MKKTLLLILIPVLVIILVMVFFGLFGIFQTPGSGQHTGYVTAVDKTGIIFQTWTAYIKTDPQSSQEDAYCVADPATITALQNYEKDRSLVTIYYSEPIVVWKWQCAHQASIIHSISIVDQSTTTAP